MNFESKISKEFRKAYNARMDEWFEEQIVGNGTGELLGILNEFAVNGSVYIDADTGEQVKVNDRIRRAVIEQSFKAEILRAYDIPLHLVEPDIYKEPNDPHPHRQDAACLGALLLNSLLSRRTPLLLSDDWNARKQAASRVQVLPREVQVLVSQDGANEFVPKTVTWMNPPN